MSACFTSAQYPLVQSCSLSGVYKDLLEFAANYLVLGGRLVFWLPIVKHECVSCEPLVSSCLESVGVSV